MVYFGCFVSVIDCISVFLVTDLSQVGFHMSWSIKSGSNSTVIFTILSIVNILAKRS